MNSICRAGGGISDAAHLTVKGRGFQFDSSATSPWSPRTPCALLILKAGIIHKYLKSNYFDKTIPGPLFPAKST